MKPLAKQERIVEQGGVDEIDTQVHSELLLEMTILASESDLINPRKLAHILNHDDGAGDYDSLILDL